MNDDAAIPGPAITSLRQLPNHRITPGDPDVRGWEVIGADGQVIGRVDDLLVDAKAMRVRYLDVELAPGLVAGSAGEGSSARHALIPVGNARLDPRQDRILVEGLPSGQAAGLPAYAGQELTRDYETGLRRSFDQGYRDAPEQDFYAHDLYDEDRFYGPRRQPRTAAEAVADTARVAGLEPGRGSGAPEREITGELDRTVDEAPSRDEAELPVRGR